MARKSPTTDSEVMKATLGDNSTLGRPAVLSEIGYNGLSLFQGVTNDELKKELNFPNNIKIYKQMSYHTSINASLSLYANLISKVEWRVVPPEDATEEEKQQTKFVNECMKDMDHSFHDFIRDCLSANVFGFSVHEKVFRRRLKAKGSLFNDGKIGLKKLALRNQETIDKFIFDDKGNDVIAVVQDLSGHTDVYNRYAVRVDSEVTIPRSKFMLLTVGRNRNDPYGKSPLRDVYLAWRYLTVIEELEAQGAAKDLQGFPVLYVPAQYMAPDASPEQKALYESFKNIIRNLQNNSQSGLILPSATDPETKKELFKIELLSTEGKKNFDLTEVKQYYLNQIFTGLASDVLILGQNGVGSFALSQVKNSLTGAAAETLLDNIVDTFNREVIRQLYDLNGWDASRACTLDYDNLHSVDLETVSKAYQRMASVSLIEKDRQILNSVRTALGVDPLPEDMEPQQDLITPMTSRSGDGMEEGRTGNGTATTVTGEDTSSNNLENAA